MQRVTASPLVLSLLLGLAAIGLGLIARATITGRFGGFGNDAGTIQEIMTSPFSATDLGYGSYSVIAEFYSGLGMADSPTAASVLGAIIGSTALGIVLVRIGGIHLGRVSLILALATPVLIGLYQATYTKEVLISLGIIVIALMPLNLLGEIIVVVTLLVLGLEYRTYWSIVAGLYVLIRFVLSRRHTLTGRRVSPKVSRVIWMIIGLSALAGLAIWIGTGQPADYFRTAVNEGEARQENTGSLISRYIELPEPLGGMVNVVLSTLFFIVPLPMVLKLSPYYLIIGCVFAFIWINAVRTAAATSRAYGTADSPYRSERVPVAETRLMARFIAVPLAFLIVQGLFEPDWGSALRHATPMVPLLVGAVALAERQHNRRRHVPSPSQQPQQPLQPLQPQQNLQTRTLPMTARHSQTTDGAAEKNYLATYAGYLARWFWMIIAGAVAGALIGWGASALMTKQYTATSQLYVGTPNSANSADAYRGSLLSQAQVGTFAEIAGSRALAERVVDDLGLDESIGEVSDMISAGANQDTVVLGLNVTAPDAGQARDIANSAATQLSQMVSELNDTTGAGATGSASLAPFNDATTPEDPSSPLTLQNILIGAVAGGLIGVIAALARGVTDRRIRNRDEIETITGLPGVGMISTTDDLAERHVLDFTGAPVAAAEQFRELRTNLRFLDVDNRPSVIAVTSGMPSEGKSTVAANLALALADDGESVCLVDADLRRPQVANYLGENLQTAVGLSTVLAGEAEINEVTQQVRAEGLSVITSGPQPPNPSELLGSKRFTTLLETLGEQYDYVIIDASPVLPVTDATLVATAADGVLLTVRYANTTSEQLSQTSSNLRQVGAHVLGTVVTMSPIKASSYGKKGYGYGYSSTAQAVDRQRQNASTSAPAASSETAASSEASDSSSGSTGPGGDTGSTGPTGSSEPSAHTHA
ncbi:MAG TPA: polysaccharide biosynthesis tyrosine autokinase [Candidatus Corynebacterium avicola]|uniref:non-specific protein-tyrosine kinase n=1 Tax=Candidatus Corynebacterium avicola TaxID=2838527 RepID=A0A9D1UKS5_9CORY|nr:polysaccharide biosynthesis tyrosine autokinase [Candidatus Corynebacterium avicola]